MIWVITYFPVYHADKTDADQLLDAFAAEYPHEDAEAISARADIALNEASLVNSYAGRMGRFIEPLFKPLGFNWKIVIASITGFAAKEVAVSTLGILYKTGGDETEGSGSLRSALANDPSMTPLTAFVLMLFVLIIPPCFAALAAIKTEIGWKWLGFEIAFLFIFGWVLCFLVYQIASLAGFA